MEGMTHVWSQPSVYIKFQGREHQQKKHIFKKNDANLFVGRLGIQTAQQLTAFVALVEDLNLVLSVYM